MEPVPQCTAAIRQAVNELNLTTPRLVLQKFSRRDVEHNVRHELDAGLMRYIRDPWDEPTTRTRSQRLARAWTGKEGVWALCAIRPRQSAAQADSYLGLVCLRYESVANATLEIGWRLGAENHGQGLATEAAVALLDFISTALRPHKVVAYCVPENIPSTRIMAALGLQREGLLRAAEKIAGQWQDIAVYGRIMDT
jgi:RimJ/RimL family protein N-acetyltransferase